MPSSLFDQIQALEIAIEGLRAHIVSDNEEITAKQSQILSLYRQLLGAVGSDSIFNALTLNLGLENPIASVANNDPVQYTPYAMIAGDTVIPAISLSINDLWAKCNVQKNDWNWTSAGVVGDPPLNGLACVLTMQKTGTNYKITLSNASTILTGTNDEKKLAIARLLIVWFVEVMEITGLNLDAATTLEGLFGDQIIAMTANKDLVSEIRTALTV